MGGGTVWPDFGTIEYIVYWCIDAFVFVCVNLFVLVSGYCLVTTEFKLSRIVRLCLHIDLQVSRKRNKCCAIIEIGGSFYNRGILVCDGLCDIAVFLPIH